MRSGPCGKTATPPFFFSSPGCIGCSLPLPYKPDPFALVARIGGDTVGILSWLRPSTRPARRRNTTHASFRPWLLVLEDRTLLSTFTVLNLNDSGLGSLRQAIFAANLLPGADVIQFRPGLSGVMAL